MLVLSAVPIILLYNTKAMYQQKAFIFWRIWPMAKTIAGEKKPDTWLEVSCVMKKRISWYAWRPWSVLVWREKRDFWKFVKIRFLQFLSVHRRFMNDRKCLKLTPLERCHSELSGDVLKKKITKILRKSGEMRKKEIVPKIAQSHNWTKVILISN